MDDPTSDFEPTARSPIAPSSPVLRDGWEVSGTTAQGALCIADCTPLPKIIVRAEATSAAAERLATPHGRASRVGDVLVVGSSPGEWTLIGQGAEALAKSACETDGDAFTNQIDQTHGRALVRITGERAADLLAKVCGIDLHDRVTPNGTAFRSSVAKIVTDVAREDVDGVRSYLLHCERSSGQSLYDGLLDAGREFDIQQGA